VRQSKALGHWFAAMPEEAQPNVALHDRRPGRRAAAREAIRHARPPHQARHPAPPSLAEPGCAVLRGHRKTRCSKAFPGVEDDARVMRETCLDAPAQAEMLFLENLHSYDDALLRRAQLRKARAGSYNARSFP
jgi:hypothetical protein